MDRSGHGPFDGSGDRTGPHKAGALRVHRLPRPAYEILRAIDETHSLDRAMDRVLAMPRVLRHRDLARVERWFAASDEARKARKARKGEGA